MNVKINITMMKKNAKEFGEPVATILLQEPDEMDLETFINDLGLLEKLIQTKKNKLCDTHEKFLRGDNA